MKRLHLFELHDFNWLPSIWRECLTDFLSFYSYHVNPYKPAIKRLCIAMKQSNTRQIVDLCSGKGLYMLKLIKCMTDMNCKLDKIILTDKYPCPKTFESLKTRSNGHIQYIRDSVDAINVQSNLKGFRTFFSSFHHFSPDNAQKIINDAVKAKQGIAIFEYSSRNPIIAFNAALFGPILLLILTPFIRPFTYRRLLWTYLLPIVPVIFCWDGLVSHLRTYTVKELKSFAFETGSNNYKWEINKIRLYFGFCHITYLIGYPLTILDNK